MMSIHSSETLRQWSKEKKIEAQSLPVILGALEFSMQPRLSPNLQSSGILKL